MLIKVMDFFRNSFRWILDNRNFLFAGNDSLFKNIVTNCTIYGEYGVGKSTKWVINNTSAEIRAVDTSAKWIRRVMNGHSMDRRLDICHSNLGNVGFMGRPRDYSKRDDFSSYTDYLWKKDKNPDVVLIDGRFRVCCFLTSLKFGDEGTKIIFDDYVNRPHYHIVEKYIPRSRECGRQALFIVPPKENIDIDELNNDIAAFRLVMD